MKINPLFLKCNRVKIWCCRRMKNTKLLNRKEDKRSGEFRISQIWGPNARCGVPAYYIAKLFAENGMNMK